MRIALVSPNFAEYAALTAKGLESECDVVLFADAINYQQEVGDREKIGPAALRLEKLESITGWLRVIRAVRKFNPDVIHLQEPGGGRKTIGMLLLALYFFFKVPLVLTVHDPVPHAGNDYRIAARSRVLKKLLRSLPRTIVLHGRYCVDLFAPQKRKWQVLHSIDHGVILSPAALQKAKPQQNHFLFFGRMEAYKGLRVLCEAIDVLQSKDVQFSVCFAGRGPELGYVKQRLKLHSNVEIVEGFISPGDLIREIQRAEFVVVPYTEATQSGVVSAAYANGRFVLASSVGGLVNVVSNDRDGILVPAGDISALSSAIQATLQDRDLMVRLSEGAEATANGRLSWTKICKELVVIYGSTSRAVPVL